MANEFDRADRMAIAASTHKFSTIIDLNGLTWQRCPPMETISEIFNLLKWGYPLRLDKVFLLNSGFVFSMVWKFITPLLPRKAISKVYMLNGADIGKVLGELVGLDVVEEELGGFMKNPIANDHSIQEYIRSGYWESQSRSVE